MVITLICTSGASTDIVVSRMKKVCDADDVITAISVRQMDEVIPKSDVILLGPQAKSYLKTAREIAEPYGVPVDVIDVRMFGRFNGQEVLDYARKVAARRNG